MRVQNGRRLAFQLFITLAVLGVIGGSDAFAERPKRAKGKVATSASSKASSKASNDATSTAPVDDVQATEGPAAVQSKYLEAQPSSFDGDVRTLAGPENTNFTPGELRQSGDEVGTDEPPLNQLPPSPESTVPPLSATTSGGPGPGPLAPAPAATINVDGMGNADFGGNVVPPDPSGAVGLSYYVQFLNAAQGSTVGIYRKTDGTRASQFYYASLFSAVPTGTQCDTVNHTDTQVSYDSVNNRFILMDITTTSPYQFCIAVSKTSDPITGGWWIYTLAANQGNTTLPDYEKMGIWPDGVYWGSQGGGVSGGPEAWAADIAKMEAGLTAGVKVFYLGNDATYVRPTPSTYNVKTGTPPAGTPNYFMTMWNGANMRIWKFHTDWVTPANATFTGPTTIGNSWTITGATVVSTANALDTLREHTIQSNVYTNIGGVESIWNQHTVGNPSASTIAVPRFFQILVTGGTINTTPRQDSEFRPDNTISRWMTGIGVDQAGNMLLEYSVTNASVNPGVRYAAQLSTDPVNTLSLTETVLVNGGGGFSANCGGTCHRWGDYSNVSLDPVDGCTLWFNGEYMAATGLNWSTRIGAVTLPGCASGGTLTGTVTESGSGSPISGATVSTTGASVNSTTTNASGVYTFTNIAVGSYTVSASKTGYAGASSAASVTLNTTTTTNFALAPNVLQGTVTAAVGGAPIVGATVSTTGASVNSTTTNASGFYKFNAIAAGSYAVTVTAAGYNNGSASGVSVTAGGTTTQNFALTVSPVTCLTDTTQANWQAGVATNLDLTSSPGDVKLALASTGTETLDQQNTSVGGTGQTVSTTLWVAQTFIPGLAGNMTRADVDLFCSGCSSTQPITAEIRPTSAGLPTDTVLASTTIPAFTSGTGTFYTATFGTPAALATGTTYALVLRLTVANTAGNYAWLRSNSNQYANGAYIQGTTCALANSPDCAWASNSQDFGFKTYITPPTTFQSSGNLASSTKDAIPLVGDRVRWTSLGWISTVPANTTVRFQAAASNNVAGPFTFVGPDGTSGTFFTADASCSAGSTTLSQFSGNRYLKYKALLDTTVNTTTPTLSDVTVGYFTCNSQPNGTACDDGNACTYNDVCTSGVCGGTTITCTSDTCATRACNGTSTCTVTPVTNGTSCNDGNVCTYSDVCTGGTCGGTAITCTGDQCNTSACNGTSTCTVTPKTNGTVCNDLNDCTYNDQCTAGTCGGTSITCTDDACNTKTCNGTSTCTVTPKTDGTGCSDGNACTLGDTCQSGSCSPGAPVTCTALDQCHNVGTCDTGTGVCSNPAKTNGTSCDDGNACTVGDTCQSGSCSPGAPVTCTASDQCHNAGTCDTFTGLCSNPAKANGSSCTDGNACTVADTCQSGACSPGAPVTCTALDQCHDIGTCDTGTGVCSNPAKTNGTACNDANACTQTDTCQSGTCTGSNPVSCTASDQCHVAGTCDTGTGVCSNPNATDGTGCNADSNACTVGDSCSSGVCVAGPATVCTASDQCHVAGTCDTGTGACSNPLATDGTSCDDGDNCNGVSTCQAGSCTPTTPPVTCTASDVCHVAGTCNPLTGTCSNPIATDGTSCDDGDNCNGVSTCQAGSCTPTTPPVTCTASDVCHVAGTCNPGTGTCSNPAKTDGTSCDDGDNCNGVSTCQAGSCTQTTPPVTCTASDVCHVAGTCNPFTGTCSNPAKTDGTSCDDGDNCNGVSTCQAGSCTQTTPPVTCTASDVCHVAGTCNPGTGTCSNPAKTDGTSCDDGDNCNGVSTCQAGSCTQTTPPVTCAASDVCHVAGTCNPFTGTCSNPAKTDGTSCDDGDNCNGVSTCQAGSCTQTTPPVTCTASDVCHVAGVCNPGTGTCSNPAKTDGTSCDDGDNCNGVSTCQAGSCTQTTPPVTCTASDVCHVAGVCNPGTGTCSNPAKTDGTSCDDGDNCNGVSTCQAGSCTQTTPPVTCTASDQCHVAGTCNPLAGTCSNPIATNGTSCDDGDNCNGVSTCQSGSCTQTTPPVTCTASDVCHVAGVCNPGTGTCSNPIATNGTSCDDGDNCNGVSTCQSGSCTQTTPPVTCTASDQCHVAGVCNPGTGTCSNPIATNGTSCDDGDNCNGVSTCQAGSCTPTTPPVTCTASDVCHVAGTCNPLTGTCSNPAKTDGTSCDDGDNCNGVSTCQAGVCTQTTAPVTCTASDVCHVAGVCNAGTGLCSNPAKTDGTSCDDGDNCNGVSTCQAGSCTQTTAPVTCTPSDQCHVAGTCDTGTGACSNPIATNGTGCSDGSACTVGDTCQSGSCSPGTPVTCTALDQCHVAGTCNPSTGVCSNPNATNGTGCTDGNPCTVGDTCQGGSCSSGAPLVCNDNNSCTNDACVGGVCQFVANDGNSCTDGNVCTTDVCSSGTCLHSASGSCGVSGSVVYYRPNPSSAKAVSGVPIDWNQDLSSDATTDASGLFSIASVSGNVHVAPLGKYGSPRASDHNGAITSLDASMAARASVNLIVLTNGQTVAADVTGNGSLSALDASDISQFVIGMMDHFPVATTNGSDWAFERCSAYGSPEASSCVAPAYDYTPITGPQTGADFAGILYGEVTGNWQPASSLSTASPMSVEEAAAFERDLAARKVYLPGPRLDIGRPSSTGSAVLSLSAWGGMRAGATRQITVNLANADGIRALDLSLGYDPAMLAVTDVKVAGIGSAYTVVANNAAGTTKVAAFGVLPLQGSGAFLTVTVHALRDTTAQPFRVRASANEGAIPLVIGRARALGAQ